MSYLQKLPDSRRHPPGLEWKILKKLPMATLASVAIPLIWYGLAMLYPQAAPGETVEKHLIGVSIGAIATAVTALTAVFTLAIACIVVVLMKGPAYVADRYPLSDADQPRERHETDGR
jgi:hypothetical protein